MEIQAYLQSLQGGLYGKSGSVQVDVERLKEILNHVNSLERALADVLRLAYAPKPGTERLKLDSKTW